MRLLMLGAPGAGKGTQASRLARHFGIQNIASGELLRREVADRTPLGRMVSGYLERGDLIPDDLMLDVITPRIDAASGFVLDGFPRNLEQQEAAEGRGLFEGRRLDAAVYLEVDADELLRRLLLRAGKEGRSRRSGGDHPPPAVTLRCRDPAAHRLLPRRRGAAHHRRATGRRQGHPHHPRSTGAAQQVTRAGSAAARWCTSLRVRTTRRPSPASTRLTEAWAGRKNMSTSRPRMCPM